MIGVVKDVFEISGRDTVVLVEINSGLCQIGDHLKVGEDTWPITGIEMINYGTKGYQRMQEGWTPPIGILLKDASKEQLLDFIGAEVATLERREVQSPN